MKCKVTIRGPLFFSDMDAAVALAKLAGPGAVIELVGDDDGVVSQPVVGAGPVGVKGRRGRPRKQPPAESADVRVKEVQAEPVQAEAEPVTPEFSRKSLHKAFGDLVDVDYDAAASLLEEFGVANFSSLPDDKLAAFGKRLQQYV
jgi:hypothetical protein